MDKAFIEVFVTQKRASIKKQFPCKTMRDFEFSKVKKILELSAQQRGNMNNILKETARTPDTSKQTPIEIALGVDEQGMTTAKKLYKFLELEPAHYARWCEKNILQNKFAERDVDFWAFTINGEWGGQATTDFKLTASFAKKLSMASKSSKGEAARNYFVGIENGTKKLVKQVPLTEHPGEVANYLKAMDRRMEKEGIAPWKIAEAFKMVSEQYGIRLPDDFVKVPEYEQMGLWDK